MRRRTGPGRRDRAARWGRRARATCAALLLAACAGSGDEPDPPAADTTSAGTVRFVLEVAEGEHGPVWIQAVSESRPVAWLTVSGAEGRVFLEPRCDVPDCGAEAAVCGAAIPIVRRLAEAGGSGSVAYEWNGMTSVVAAEEQCERRVDAPPGEYTVRVCRSESADADDSGDPAVGVMGRLLEPTCEERSFTLGEDREVRVRID